MVASIKLALRFGILLVLTGYLAPGYAQERKEDINDQGVFKSDIPSTQSTAPYSTTLQPSELSKEETNAPKTPANSKEEALDLTSTEAPVVLGDTLQPSSANFHPDTPEGDDKGGFVTTHRPIVHDTTFIDDLLNTTEGRSSVDHTPIAQRTSSLTLDFTDLNNKTEVTTSTQLAKNISSSPIQSSTDAVQKAHSTTIEPNLKTDMLKPELSKEVTSKSPESNSSRKKIDAHSTTVMMTVMEMEDETNSYEHITISQTPEDNSFTDSGTNLVTAKQNEDDTEAYTITKYKQENPDEMATSYDDTTMSHSKLNEGLDTELSTLDFADLNNKTEVTTSLQLDKNSSSPVSPSMQSSTDAVQKAHSTTLEPNLKTDMLKPEISKEVTTKSPESNSSHKKIDAHSTSVMMTVIEMGDETNSYEHITISQVAEDNSFTDSGTNLGTAKQNEDVTEAYTTTKYKQKTPVEMVTSYDETTMSHKLSEGLDIELTTESQKSPDLKTNPAESDKTSTIMPGSKEKLTEYPILRHTTAGPIDDAMFSPTNAVTVTNTSKTKQAHTSTISTDEQSLQITTVKQSIYEKSTMAYPILTAEETTDTFIQPHASTMMLHTETTLDSATRTSSEQKGSDDETLTGVETTFDQFELNGFSDTTSTYTEFSKLFTDTDKTFAVTSGNTKKVYPAFSATSEDGSGFVDELITTPTFVTRDISFTQKYKTTDVRDKITSKSTQNNTTVSSLISTHEDRSEDAGEQSTTLTFSSSAKSVNTEYTATAFHDKVTSRSTEKSIPVSLVFSTPEDGSGDIEEFITTPTFFPSVQSVTKESETTDKSTLRSANDFTTFPSFEYRTSIHENTGDNTISTLKPYANTENFKTEFLSSGEVDTTWSTDDSAFNLKTTSWSPKEDTSGDMLMTTQVLFTTSAEKSTKHSTYFKDKGFLTTVYPGDAKVTNESFDSSGESVGTTDSIIHSNEHEISGDNDFITYEPTEVETSGKLTQFQTTGLHFGSFGEVSSTETPIIIPFTTVEDASGEVELSTGFSTAKTTEEKDSSTSVTQPIDVELGSGDEVPTTETNIKTDEGGSGDVDLSTILSVEMMKTTEEGSGEPFFTTSSLVLTTETTDLSFGSGDLSLTTDFPTTKLPGKDGSGDTELSTVFSFEITTAESSGEDLITVSSTSAERTTDLYIGSGDTTTEILFTQDLTTDEERSGDTEFPAVFSTAITTEDDLNEEFITLSTIFSKETTLSDSGSGDLISTTEQVFSTSFVPEETSGDINFSTTLLTGIGSGEGSGDDFTASSVFTTETTSQAVGSSADGTDETTTTEMSFTPMFSTQEDASGNFELSTVFSTEITTSDGSGEEFISTSISSVFTTEESSGDIDFPTVFPISQETSSSQDLSTKLVPTKTTIEEGSGDINFTTLAQVTSSSTKSRDISTDESFSGAFSTDDDMFASSEVQTTLSSVYKTTKGPATVGVTEYSLTTDKDGESGDLDMTPTIITQRKTTFTDVGELTTLTPSTDDTTLEKIDTTAYFDKDITEAFVTSTDGETTANPIAETSTRQKSTQYQTTERVATAKAETSTRQQSTQYENTEVVTTTKASETTMGQLSTEVDKTAQTTMAIKKITTAVEATSESVHTTEKLQTTTVQPERITTSDIGTTTKVQPQTTSAVSSSTRVTLETVILEGEFRVTEGLRYEDSLQDTSSLQYHSTSDTFRNLITDIFESSALRTKFIDAYSFTFRNGSVIVRFLLAFHGNVSKENVMAIFKEGMTNTEYTVDPNSISFTDLQPGTEEPTTLETTTKEREKIIEYRVPSWAIGVIIAAGILLVFLLLLGVVWCCTTSSKEKAYYTVPHSNSSYSDASANGEYSVQSKQDMQLFGTFDVVDEKTPGAVGGKAVNGKQRIAVYNNSTPVTKGAIRVSRQSSGATNGHLYFEEGDSPVTVKRESKGPQADNVMEEIQMHDILIYDPSTIAVKGRHSPDILDSNHPYRAANGTRMSTFKEPEWKTVTPSEIKVLTYPFNENTKTYYDVELGIWSTRL